METLSSIKREDYKGILTEVCKIQKEVGYIKPKLHNNFIAKFTIIVHILKYSTISS